MTEQSVKRVVFHPDAYEGMQRGINQMANAVRPTLGPFPRNVAVEHPVRTRVPELLDNGAVIMKRLIELPDRDADMGAMFLRHVLLHVQNRAGDGTATAAIILQSVFNEGIRFIAAGGNPMKLRRYLDAGTKAILAELDTMTRRIKGQAALTRLANTICHDTAIAEELGEIFSMIGGYGRLDVEAGHSRRLDTQFVQGLFWGSEPFSKDMLFDKAKLRTELHDAAICMSNLDIETVAQILPVLEAAKAGNHPHLIIFAHGISSEVTGLLAANSKQSAFKVVAVNAPGSGFTQQAEALQDMAYFTGGHVYNQAGGELDFSGFTPDDFGFARQVWVESENFGMIGGRGNARELRAHIAKLQDKLQRTENIDDRQALHERIGKLISGAVILKVGGATDAEILNRRDSAKQAADAMRGAIIDGVLPGAGVALLNCQAALREKLAKAADAEERAAYRILIKATESPIRTIAENAGYETAHVMDQIQQAGSGYAFDVVKGGVVDVAEAGIYDVATAQKTAVQSAISSAALALTTEVLVHHKKRATPTISGPDASKFGLGA
ncbi:MAG: chaperonin GroEL [Chloroflexota bacterium]